MPAVPMPKITLILGPGDSLSLPANEALALASELWNRGNFLNVRGAIPLSVELTLAAKKPNTARPVRIDPHDLPLLTDSLGRLAVTLRLSAELGALHEHLLRAQG